MRARDDDVFFSASSNVDETISYANPFARPQQRPPLHDEDACRWKSGIRLDLPEFDGSGKLDLFLDWLSSIEELLDFKTVPLDRRVALVVTRLRGRVMTWWQQLKTH